MPNSADEQALLPFVRIAGERAQACRDGAGKGFVVPGVKAAHRDHDPVEAYPSPEQGVAVPQQVRSTYLDDVAVDAELPAEPGLGARHSRVVGIPPLPVADGAFMQDRFLEAAGAGNPRGIHDDDVKGPAFAETRVRHGGLDR